MANMSYCRFENTSHALKDCVDVLQEELDNLDGWDLKQSETEFVAAKRMVSLCKRYVELYEELVEVREAD
jgi:hypothetical protein